MIVYFILIFALIFFFFREKRFRAKSLNNWTWPAVFTINALAGLAFLYVYTYIEGDGALSQDAGAYLQEGKILQDVFFESPLDYLKLLFGFGDTDALTQQYLIDTNHWDTGPQAISDESRNIIRLHSVLQFVSFNEPVIHILFMSLISTLSGIYLFRVISGITKMNSTVAVALLCFLPNVLFWSNGILKEPLYLLGFSLIIYSIFSVNNGIKIWLTFTAGILLLLLFKFHFLIVVLFGMSVWFLSTFLSKRKVLYTFFTSTLVVIIIFTLSASVRNIVTQKISRKQFDFNNISRGGLYFESDSSVYFFSEKSISNLVIKNDSIRVMQDIIAERIDFKNTESPERIKVTPEMGWFKVNFYMPKSQSYFLITPIKSDFNNLINSIPEALMNCFFRPFISEKGGLFKWVSILELILVWTLFLISLKWSASMSNQSKELFLFLGTVIILSALLIGWTTPVSGAIVRYRVPIHICMILMVLINWNQKKKSHE